MSFKPPTDAYSSFHKSSTQRRPFLLITGLVLYLTVLATVKSSKTQQKERPNQVTLHSTASKDKAIKRGRWQLHEGSAFQAVCHAVLCLFLRVQQELQRFSIISIPSFLMSPQHFLGQLSSTVSLISLPFPFSAPPP